MSAVTSAATPSPTPSAPAAAPPQPSHPPLPKPPRASAAASAAAAAAASAAASSLSSPPPLRRQSEPTPSLNPATPSASLAQKPSANAAAAAPSITMTPATPSVSSSDVDPFSDPIATLERSLSITAMDRSSVGGLTTSGGVAAANGSSNSSSRSESPSGARKSSMRKSPPAPPKPKMSLKEEVEEVKKVNFWGWVDVGFSHSTDDYDRTPIEPEPLTREGAIEVIQMRMEMRKVTQELMQWREEYQKAIDRSHPGQEAPTDAAVLQAFLNRNPPVPPAMYPPPPRRPQYPHPEYPQQMYPRQSPMSTDSAASSAAVGSAANAAAATAQPAQQATTAPPKPPKPSRISTLVAARSNTMGSLERPHSHHEIGAASSSTSSSSAAALPGSPAPPRGAFDLPPRPTITRQQTTGSIPQQATAGASSPGSASTGGGIGSFMGRIVPGARWSWNEAVAQQHKRKQQQGQ
ncbi:hypothetical protein DFJ73DRAFT_283413 [Zopfochytrium polystomum]|nr:hypothetical protein DFJ73DRAFT_283413 [Zopfochytrium polystomum]